MGDFERADRVILEGTKILTNEGNYAKQSWVGGLYSFRTAHVAVSQDRIPDAIKTAELAVAISRSSRAPTCVLARYTHLLSKALLKDHERQIEGEKKKKEAQRLRKLLLPGHRDLDDESDAAYDRLVNIVQR